MRLIQRRINSLLRRWGYGMSRANSLSGHLRQLLARLQADCVLDVGANDGCYGSFLRKEVGYREWIISFEPVTRLYQELQRKADNDAKWAALRLALGSEDGTKVLHVARNTVFSSFLESDHSVVRRFRSENRVQVNETVPIQRLASIFGELRAKYGFQRAFLKMDTQGYDLEVLKGATHVLGNICGLQSEVSLLPIYKSMPSMTETFLAVKKSGFDLTGTFPVNCDEFGRIIEMDWVFVNRACCGHSELT